jgi:predicted phage terminase large subunit-like protein
MRKRTVEEHLIEIERERGRRSLHYFISKAWHVIEPAAPYMDNWHVACIAEHLQAMTAGQLRNVIFNVPPGSGKSNVVSVLWNAWAWLRNPAETFLYTSFDGLLTKRDAGKVQTLISSPWFQARWSDLFRLDPNDGVGEFNVYDAHGQPTGGWRFSTSVDGKTTGRHPLNRVIDDPIKPKNVTKLSLDEVVNWWQTTMASRGDHRVRRTGIIMQRVAENDLSGHVLAHESGWEHVCIPLEYTGKTFSTSIGWEDPRAVEGESFWQERFTPTVIQEIKTNNDPTVVSAQYGQNPVPPGGSIFKAETFKRWTLSPATVDDYTYQGRVKSSLPSDGFYLQSWDFSFKGTDGSDWCVGTCWYVAGAQFSLIDLVRRRLEFADLVDEVKSFAAKWPKAHTILIEDKANGPAIMSTLKRVVPGMVPYSPGADSKVTRAMAVQGVFRAGNVFFPDTGNEYAAVWAHDYETELIGFPRAAHDDQVDSTSQALEYAASNMTFIPDMKDAVDNLERELLG